MRAQEVARLCQESRKELGMTQEDFAKAFDLPLATVRNWEQQRVEPDSTVLTLLRIIRHDPSTAHWAMKCAIIIDHPKIRVGT